ncbi:TetR/AcrR family transcriptional regulator [Paenibacillus protaetiae]|uniref:TetR/AcrR family transcriptional regulator n=1 Tax=Paenibacillus protaetiae TaxID=2509456 RepID=A0A4V0YFL3_9BACL|nr:TetR/AcrR family transcriptional regulator [Paenibacillus protaetiae]QAY68111.1 TetR/AcrR family transcriptional regulator [Paenibacillus protaetiae]
MEQTKTKIDPRVIRTRQLLKDAFIDLLQEMDLEKISVNRIAERATINRVTFYLHYRDIPDMMEKMADEMIEDMEKKIIIRGSRFNEEENGNSQMLLRFLEYIADNAKFFKVILASRRIPVFTDRILKLLIESIAFRVGEKIDSDPVTSEGIQKDIIVWYASSALIGTIVNWLRNDMPYSPHYLAKQFALLGTLKH